MNHDPVYERLRELSWRRPLTENERAELRVWLAAHPEAQAEFEADEALNASLARLPDAPVPSNFTSRVLQQIERETAIGERTTAKSPSIWWRAFILRLAMASVVVVSGLLGYKHYETTRREELSVAAKQIAGAQMLSDPAILQDFEVICSISPTETAADESLLAMSDDLMAMHKQ